MASEPKSNKSIAPQWGTPDRVFQTTETMQRVETARAMDRAKVDALANGSRPYTEAEMKEFAHQMNVNWLELTRKLQDAIGQVNNAFIPAGNFFTAHSVGGKVSEREHYGIQFTKLINGILKKKQSGKRHHYVLRSRNACVALHGIGPLMWTNSTRLFPRFVPLEDLLIPTDTLLDFSVNPTHFAVNLYLTPGELYRMACMGNPDPGWKQEAVKQLLQDLKDDNNIPYFPPNVSFWQQRPEALQELYRQNSGYLESDAVQKAKLRAFYFQNPDDQKWYRKIILRENTPHVAARGDKAVFIYDGKGPFADDIDHIIHCQFGDNSLIAPLKYHSVRGIGTMLYAPSYTLNRLRSQTIQHLSQNLQTWWRIQDPTDRDRTKQILLMNNGIIPEGASLIPSNERFTVDPTLLEFGFAQMKQNISENSTSYAPGLDTGTNKERTKFEVQAQLQSASAMVGNVLSMMYAQEIFYYEELVRRILIKTTDDPWAKKFQAQCRAAGIPESLMEPENWKILPERVLGAGDNALAQAQADALMSQKQTFEPDSQRKVQRMWVSTLLDDPERAAELVPEPQDQTNSGTRTAEDVFATLMLGVAVPMRKGIDHAGYCAALESMMQVQIQRIMQTDGMGTPQDIIGFNTVANSVSENLQFLAQDPQNKPVVKELADGIGQLMNEVKGMAQRQQEALSKQNPQIDPEAMAKAQATQMLAQVKAETTQQLAELKAQINAMQAQQKMAQKQMAFEQKQAQQAQSHEAKLAAQGQSTEANLMAQGMQVGADVQATKLKTEADVEASKEKAKATPAKEND